MQRNPSGAVDRRCRATLRPMSKNRRDSSVCELEQRLRDVKTTNCRFRKALMERESELQALIRKLGPEARSWLETGNTETEPTTINTQKENMKLSVPMIRRDLPSATGKIYFIDICLTEQHIRLLRYYVPVYQVEDFALLLQRSSFLLPPAVNKSVDDSTSKFLFIISVIILCLFHMLCTFHNAVRNQTYSFLLKCKGPQCLICTHKTNHL